MTKQLAQKLIKAAGTKDAAWELLRAYWALSTNENTPAAIAASNHIGAAYEAAYGK